MLFSAEMPGELKVLYAVLFLALPAVIAWGVPALIRWLIRMSNPKQQVQPTQAKVTLFSKGGFSWEERVTTGKPAGEAPPRDTAALQEETRIKAAPDAHIRRDGV